MRPLIVFASALVITALVFQHQKLTLDGPHRLLRNISILSGQIAGMLGDESQNRTQVFHVEKQQSLLVRDLESDIHHAFLDIVEVHHAREQKWTHFGDGGAHRMALLAEDVPKHR